MIFIQKINFELSNFVMAHLWESICAVIFARFIYDLIRVMIWPTH